MDLALLHGETDWQRPGLRDATHGRPLLIPASGARSGVLPDASALVVAVARRDRAAFATLFDHFAPRVKSYMLKLGATPAAAEELAQEALLTVWRKADSFDPSRAGAAAWIFTIARNLRIDAVRRDRIFRVLDAEPPEEASAEPGPEAMLAETQRSDLIRQAMATLPREQVEVLRLSFFEDKAHGEIADSLQLPLGTVKSRLRLAMSRLKAILGDRS
jgi:RNA polymerase sigma-70 factor (ECF subfamily)